MFRTNVSRVKRVGTLGQVVGPAVNVLAGVNNTRRRGFFSLRRGYVRGLALFGSYSIMVCGKSGRLVDGYMTGSVLATHRVT